MAGLVLAVLFAAGLPLHAQTAVFPYWLTLEQGKRLFRDGDYGKALIAFEDARRQRKTMYADYERSWINLLSLSEVRKLDDSLARIEKYISENNELKARRALDELYLRVPKERLRDSGLEALRWLGTLREYPEAEYWIGETYRLEGELAIALRQYRLAYEQRSLLQTPDFYIEIMYRMADIHYQRQEYNNMEQILTDILARDVLWSDESENFLRASMSRTLKQQGVDRFLLLYRYDFSLSEKAHRQLGLYYYATGRHSRALDHLLFSFLIQTTTVVNELKRLDFDFAFSGYRSLLASAGERAQLVDYMRQTEYYRTAYYLGAALFAVGDRSSAAEIWKVLSVQAAGGEWQDRARRQLLAPQIEPVVEKP